jgi:hypothetical protein
MPRSRASTRARSSRHARVLPGRPPVRARVWTGQRPRPSVAMFGHPASEHTLTAPMRTGCLGARLLGEFWRNSSRPPFRGFGRVIGPAAPPELAHAGGRVDLR